MSPPPLSHAVSAPRRVVVQACAIWAGGPHVSDTIKGTVQRDGRGTYLDVHHSKALFNNNFTPRFEKVFFH